MKKRSIIFISLSVAIHLGVFSLLLSANPTELEIHSNSEHGSSPISIHLLTKNEPQNKSLNKPITEKNTLPIKQTTVINTPHQKKPESTYLGSAITNNIPTKPTLQSTTKETSELAYTPDHVKINNILRDELAKHFYYPAVAQRRNWQGEVLIEFTVKSNGKITQININKSSGYEILDNAAIDALRKIDSKDKFSLVLNGQSIEKTLPIIYALASR